MWEHLVLNETHAELQSRRIGYCRDKRGHEIDFVLSERRSDTIAIECKWSASDFDPANILSFRRHYPDGRNYVLANDVPKAYSCDCNGDKICFTSITGLLQDLRRGRHEDTPA